jgi:DNA-binding response OmpR family regulator
MAVKTDKAIVSRKVLVVDDDSLIRELLSQALSSNGYEVVQAESGEEALRIIENEKIFVQLFDMQLPGINGVELCRKSREMNPVAVRFAMTAYVSVFNLIEAREAGFDDYFVKPYTVDVILNNVANAFEKVERWRRGK